MRQAFIADIHGNADALQAVLTEIDLRDIQEIFCLGDIVGYGAEPSLCIQIIQERNIVSIAGNHDLAAVEAISIEQFNDSAKASTQWTTKHITNSDKEYLLNLSLELKNNEFQLAHGSPMIPAAFSYILTPPDVLLAFSAMDHDLLFTAHSHVPVALLEQGDGITAHPIGTITIPPKVRAIINVGSVGQPRDGNPDASFAIWDEETRTTEVIRVSYNVSAAENKILKAGLPEGNAYRLSLGR